MALCKFRIIIIIIYLMPTSLYLPYKHEQSILGSTLPIFP